MGCIFCQHDLPILAQTERSFACPDGFPVSEGHALIVPKRHVVTIWELTNDEYIDAFDLVRQVKDILQREFQPHGFNIGVNCGEAAGQTVFHAHIHIIPRYHGDVANPRAGYGISFPVKEITESWIATFQCSMRSSRGDLTQILTNLRYGERWQASPPRRMMCTQARTGGRMPQCCPTAAFLVSKSLKMRIVHRVCRRFSTLAAVSHW
jgi:diadenosine tetraphosphate (Ap4A) HIT family hydrolase